MQAKDPLFMWGGTKKGSVLSVKWMIFLRVVGKPLNLEIKPLNLEIKPLNLEN